jgi:excinuclease ABC subunit A
MSQSEAGNTVLVIEHNLDVIAAADWLIELGPEGGDAGGRLVYSGPVAGAVKAKGSHTGFYLTQHLGGKTAGAARR